MTSKTIVEMDLFINKLNFLKVKNLELCLEMYKSFFILIGYFSNFRCELNSAERFLNTLSEKLMKNKSLKLFSFYLNTE